MSFGSVPFGDTVYFTDYYEISGQGIQSDEQPKFWVQELQTGQTGVIDATLMISGSGEQTRFTGVYYGSFTVASGNSFEAGKWYNIVTSGKPAGRQAFHTKGPFRADTVPLTALELGASNVYYCDMNFVVDDTNERDEYTLSWFKNGAPVVNNITGCDLQVIKRSGGSDLIPLQTGLNPVANITGVFIYDATGVNERITDGEAAIAITNATIDGARKTWTRVIGRDVNT